MKKPTLRESIILALLTALLFVAQLALSFLPNIELVSLLVILYTLVYKRKALWCIYIFALLQGLFYGFTSWWVSYLYIWTALWLVTMILKEMDNALGWAIVSGAFGLCFGALSELPFLFIIGMKASFAAWVSGIPFDIAHCVGNFVLALVLYKPLVKVLRRLEKGKQNA